MTIDQADVIDIVSTSEVSPEARLIIADHLPWDVDEEQQLWLLQSKINKYLGAKESGELYQKCPKVAGKQIIIDLAPKMSSTKKYRRRLESVFVIAAPSTDARKQQSESVGRLLPATGYELTFRNASPVSGR